MERNEIRVQFSNQRNKNINPSLFLLFLWASYFLRKAEFQALRTNVCPEQPSRNERAPLLHTTFIKFRLFSTFLPYTAQAHL